jgi:hypothetical protein
LVSQAPQRLYRIILDAEPTTNDFVSYASQYIQAIRAGQAPPVSQPRRASGLHMWSGISVYDSEEAARGTAQQYGRGNFLASLVPSTDDEDQIRLEKTGQDLQHYTLWASPQVLRACVQSISKV